MSNANRDYVIVYDVKNSSLALSRPLVFYITDKNTSNIFVRLVTRISIGNGIDQYTDIEEASNYVLTMRVIKPNNEVKSLEATQHEPKSIFQFDLTEDFKDMPGKYICELTISTIVNSRQELVTSDPFSYEVKRSILSNVGEIIETEDTTVEKLLNELDATKAELSSQIKEKANESDVKNKYYDVKQGLITNNNLSNITFKRKHARNLYKNAKYHMCGMDFTRDFLNAENGNMYPQQNYLTDGYGTLLTETVSDFKYKLRNDTNSSETSKRLIGCINLFSTYEMTIEDIVTSSELGVRCGLDIRNSIDVDRYDVFVAFTNNGTLEIRSEMYLNDRTQGLKTNYSESFTGNKLTVLFTIVDSWVEVYKKVNENITFLCKVELPRKLNAIKTLADTKVNLFTRLNKNESVSYSYVENYYDCGISQGDIKPIKYKDGSTLIKNGRVYFTMSSRFQQSAYQTVISQNLSGCDYKLEGIILYTTDGATINRDFASSIKYDNDSGKFLIWNTSFTDRHCLSFGEAYCNIMHGINIVSMTPMSGGLVNDTDFKAKDQDEDADFVYNYDTKKWYMIICRMTYDSTDKKDQYRYFLFESDNPFTGYVFKDKTLTGANTGGSIVKVGNELYLVCGSNYHTTSQYDVYKLNDLSTFTALKKDFGDGGYRGWGSIFSIPCGNFTKYGWITFDRDSVNDYKWSYGNIYYYESDLLNEGCEYNVKYSY